MPGRSRSSRSGRPAATRAGSDVPSESGGMGIAEATIRYCSLGVRGDCALAAFVWLIPPGDSIGAAGAFAPRLLSQARGSAGAPHRRRPQPSAAVTSVEHIAKALKKALLVEIMAS